VQTLDAAVTGGPFGDSDPFGEPFVRSSQIGVKKNDLKPWLRQKWCISTVIGAEFVWRMEYILDLYAEPYQSDYPVVCFDEIP